MIQDLNSRLLLL